MKKRTKARRRNTGLLSNRKFVFGGLILAVIAVFALLELTGTTSFLNKDDETTTTTQTTVDNNSGIYKPATDQEKKEVDDRKLDNNTTPPPPTVENKAVILSAEQQNEIKSVVVKTQLFGSGWKNCKLTLTKDSLMITKFADALYQSEFSTCLGFSVPVDELSQSGEWKVNLTATKKDGTSFNAETKTVNVSK